MSKRLKTSQNYFIIEDTVTGIEEIREPKLDIIFKNDLGVIHFYDKTTRIHHIAKDDGYTIANTVNGDNGDAAFANIAALLLYLETNTGDSQNVTVVGFTQRLVIDDTTVLESDDATEFNIATDAKTFSMPLITAENLGLKYRFRNTGADGAIALTLSPNALDAFHGTVPNAAADSVAGGAVDKNLVLTKATANKGDWIEVTAVALTEWNITGGVGIWASEA